LDTILPDTFWPFLAAFATCFGAPTFQNFCSVVAGWVHCLGRHTVTAVALASGGLERRDVSSFHRFFARAQWTLDRLGLVIFRLVVQQLSADQPVRAALDDTLARKTGKCISLASMHHDPLWGRRHNGSYADVRIMPTWGGGRVRRMVITSA